MVTLQTAMLLHDWKYCSNMNIQSSPKIYMFDEASTSTQVDITIFAELHITTFLPKQHDFPHIITCNKSFKICYFSRSMGL